MYQGSMVAIVTPMQADGSIDKKSLKNLVDWHVEQKTAAIIVNGTTGESPTLSKEEQQEIIGIVIKQAAGRIPVIAGTGTYSTHTTIAYTQFAKDAGADACLLIAPYYNRPTQKGIYEHFKAVADHVSIPLILYNNPIRTACDILPKTTKRLAEISNIIGIKDATAKVDRIIEIQKLCGKEFEIYSGDDATAYEYMKNGAKGVISVAANIIPREMTELCEAALAGDQAKANKIQEKFSNLFKKLCLEPNPVPIKWAASELGLIPAGIRMPLLPLDSKFHAELREALHEAGLSSSH